MKHSKWIASALASMLLSGSAIAACTQSDMSGYWRIYTNGTVTDGTNAYWIWSRCRIKLESNGNVNTAESYCRYPAIVDDTKIYLTGGNIAVASNCILTGSLTGDMTVRIVEGKLNASKDVISGVGDDDLDISLFTFTGIK